MYTTTHLRLDTSTKAGRLLIAETVTRTWRWHNDTTGSARCTVCGDWISTLRLVLMGGEPESWSSALSGAMFDHLEAVHAAVA